MNACLFKHCELMWSSTYWRDFFFLFVFFVLFFNPYKTTKRKKRKAFNWYKNTYINQATFHYLFQKPHSHFKKENKKKSNLQLYHLHCRLENKPNIKQYCFTFCTSNLAFIFRWHTVSIFSDKRGKSGKQDREAAEHGVPGVQLKRLPCASVVVCYHNVRPASTEMTSVSSQVS